MSEFKKLSNDKMSKLILSKKKYMNWFLERFLERKINNYKIINKLDNKEINELDVIELLKQELETSNAHTKNKTVDLLVKTPNEIIDVEVNNIFDNNTKKRNFAYMSNIYSNSLEHGQSYDEQPKCTQINICKNIEEIYDYDNHCLLGENYKNKFIDNINFLVYDVAKYKKILYTDNKKLIGKYAHIIIFDCNEEELKLLGKYNEMAKEIGEMIKKYNDDNIYNFMTSAESYEKLHRAQLKTAKEKAMKEGFKEGIEPGIEHGLEQGIEQGIEQGLEQGFEQGREITKLQTAISLLKEKIPLDIIARATGYSQEYLKTLHL